MPLQSVTLGYLKSLSRFQSSSQNDCYAAATSLSDVSDGGLT